MIGDTIINCAQFCGGLRRLLILSLHAALKARCSSLGRFHIIMLQSKVLVSVEGIVYIQVSFRSHCDSVIRNH